ncbi:GTP cyclohydrolase I [Methylobacterium amylolyticum]|uniref:GTP cyclohydrolase I n=1 Tax=Methylobacterium sp. NEAU 140 TaxID=3064945 RepID=UPI0035230BE2
MRDSDAETVGPAPVPEDPTTTHPSREQAEAAVRTLLRWIGDDPNREGLRDTPARVVKAYESLFSGYELDGSAFLGRIFEEVQGYSELVLVRDIPFYSHCQRDMLPFFGRVHIAYYPARGVVGLSKFARVIDVLGYRLQTQEAMTTQIIDVIEAALRPRGCAAMIEARHLGPEIRGSHSGLCRAVTKAFRGVFADRPDEQARFSMLVDRAR